MTDRELLRVALDALIEPGNWDKRTQAFEALRDRLEQGDDMPKRGWVELTDEEGAEIWGDTHDIGWDRLVTPKEIVKRIEAKLKEKNR
jgi:hypothetical protein